MDLDGRGGRLLLVVEDRREESSINNEEAEFSKANNDDDDDDDASDTVRRAPALLIVDGVLGVVVALDRNRSRALARPELSPPPLLFVVSSNSSISSSDPTLPEDRECKESLREPLRLLLTRSEDLLRPVPFKDEVLSSKDDMDCGFLDDDDIFVFSTSLILKCHVLEYSISH